jgi:hypothetical protein
MMVIVSEMWIRDAKCPLCASKDKDLIEILCSSGCAIFVFVAVAPISIFGSFRQK